MQFINREISWLSFNARVLQEAEDRDVPLLERLRFLGIFSSNLDEFFRVRVATLKRLVGVGKKAKKGIGNSPKKVLAEVFNTVITLQNRFNTIYRELLTELEQEHIFIVNETQLTAAQGESVRNYFRDHVRGVLAPLMVDGIPEFPSLKDHSIYLATSLTHSAMEHKPRYALIEIPTDSVPRFLVLPPEDGKNFVILLDDVIRYCLDEVFYIFPHDTYHAWTVKLTRDAELDLLEDFNASMTEKIEKGLKQRKRGKPVRFIYDAAIDAELLDYFLRRMHLKRGDDNLVAGARYHNFKDFIGFPSLGKTGLLNPPLKNIQHPDFESRKRMLRTIQQKDVLLHYPYHSFDHFIDFLREAAIDPKVSEIKITLYRLAKNSKVANALINAVRNGKIVTVVMELQARFDEAHNIYWSDRLREEGAHVIFGIQGLKVHCKVCLITRKEKGKNKLYANIATGNYNESSATVYADHSLFTSDERLTGELQEMFDFFLNTYKVPDYQYLIMSPTGMRKKLEKMIRRETENAQKGMPAGLDVKLNNLSDVNMIGKLEEAAKAGVKIRLMVRGVCSLGLAPGELNGNITIRGVVDKYLEHSRLLIFHNGGHKQVLLTSADWMIRNLDSRVEMAAPVLDEQVKKELLDYFEIQWQDNVKARIIDQAQQNNYYRNDQQPWRSQIKIYDYLNSRSVAPGLNNLAAPALEPASSGSSKLTQQ